MSSIYRRRRRRQRSWRPAERRRHSWFGLDDVLEVLGHIVAAPFKAIGRILDDF